MSRLLDVDDVRQHGDWIKAPGGVLVFRPADPVEWSRMRSAGLWNPAMLREAHAAFVRGHRSFLIREGERRYQRDRKRVQRERARHA